MDQLRAITKQVLFLKCAYVSLGLSNISLTARTSRRMPGLSTYLSYILFLRKLLLLQLNATYHKAFHDVAIIVCKILMQFFLLSLVLHVSLAGIKKNEGRNYTLITARFAEASRQWASYILMKTALYSHLIFFCYHCNSYIIYQLGDIAQLWNLIYKIGLQSEKT